MENKPEKTTNPRRARLSNGLPYNWRQRAVELFQEAGISLDVQRVSDLERGRVNDDDQRTHLIKFILKIKEEKKQADEKRKSIIANL